jgi:hypothetical protein
MYEITNISNIYQLIQISDLQELRL